MMKTTLIRNHFPALALFGLLAALAVAFSGFTLAQDKKKAPAMPTMKDAVTRVSDKEARVNAGFEFIKKSKREATVRDKETRRLIGVVSCGVCPGGNCSGILDIAGRYTCTGCGTGGRDCTLDPFRDVLR